MSSRKVRASIYSGGGLVYANVIKRHNEFSHEEVTELINKANAYMKLKPYKSKDKIAKYLGVTCYCLKKWESQGLIELPKDFKISCGIRAVRMIPLYKDLKSSWESK